MVYYCLFDVFLSYLTTICIFSSIKMLFFTWPKSPTKSRDWAPLKRTITYTCYLSSAGDISELSSWSSNITRAVSNRLKKIHHLYLLIRLPSLCGELILTSVSFSTVSLSDSLIWEVPVLGSPRESFTEGSKIVRPVSGRSLGLKEPRLKLVTLQNVGPQYVRIGIEAYGNQATGRYSV